MSPAQTLSAGFSDPAKQSAEAFRALLQAMARPGRIETLDGVVPPQPLSTAAGITILVLCDPTTPLYVAPGLDLPELRDWIGFHTGAPLVGAEKATFALGTWEALLPLSAYPIGTAEYPDRSATLIVECPSIEATGTHLSGPGIETETRLNLPDPFALAANAAQYPLGLDFIFTAGTQVAALPRSTRLRLTEAV